MSNKYGNKHFNPDTNEDFGTLLLEYKKNLRDIEIWKRSAILSGYFYCTPYWWNQPPISYNYYIHWSDGQIAYYVGSFSYTEGINEFYENLRDELVSQGFENYDAYKIQVVATYIYFKQNYANNTTFKPETVWIERNLQMFEHPAYSHQDTKLTYSQLGNKLRTQYLYAGNMQEFNVSAWLFNKQVQYEELRELMMNEMNLIQPERGDYPPQPNWIASNNFTYNDGVYASFFAKVALNIPNHFVIDIVSTDHFYSNNFKEGTDGYSIPVSERKNFVLLKWAYPVETVRFPWNYEFKWKFPGSDYQYKTELSRDKFLYPIAENLTFVETYSGAQFPPMVDLCTRYGGNNRSIRNVNRGNYRIYNFYDMVNNGVSRDTITLTAKQADDRQRIEAALTDIGRILGLAFSIVRVGKVVGGSV
jgi:hypothetical protein